MSDCIGQTKVEIEALAITLADGVVSAKEREANIAQLLVSELVTECPVHPGHYVINREGIWGDRFLICKLGGGA